MSKTKLFKCYRQKGIFWFRFFGYGLHFKNVNLHALTFGEKEGYTKRIQIFSWSIKVLGRG